MRVLLTGGAGFIGRHVRAELAARGHSPVILDSLVEQVHGDWLTRIRAEPEIRYGRCQDYLAVHRAIEGCDAVIHLAAEVGVGQSAYAIERYVDANCRGTAVLLEAIAKRASSIKRLVVASSMSIYGEGKRRVVRHPPTSAQQLMDECGLVPVLTPEDHPLNPVSVYAITKRDQEELCLVTGRHYGVPTIALRFFNVIGPGQALSNPYTGVAAIFAAQILSGKAPTVFEDGQQSRDFVHVEDVARAVVDALEAPADVVGPMNVGTGKATTVLALATMLAEMLGGPAPVVTGQSRAGDIRHCVADVSKIKAALGWEARVSVEEALRSMVPWLKEQHGVVDRSAEAQSELAERGLVA